MPTRKVIVLGKEVTLTDRDYKAAGGEGTIYVKNGAVFKIFHDPAKAIPQQKIAELQVLEDIKNVIIPSSAVFDQKTGQHIGHVMKYIDNTEYLCKLFVNNFRIDNGIFSSDIVEIVKKMQITLNGIHKKGIIVGDYNEMNFLLDKTFTIPYHIDVDSYQTPSFKCNVIMDSVRDRKVPMGMFNELTDWFSWGIVVHQLYTGIHPFKGKHPDYKMNDFDSRMKDNVSVYNKDVTVPRFVDLDNIPAPHKDWFIKVFEKGERCIPPLADATGLMQVVKNVYIDTKSAIKAELERTYDGRIIGVYDCNGTRLVVTEKSVWQNRIQIMQFAVKIKHALLLTNVNGGIHIAIKVGDEVRFYNMSKDVIATVKATDMMWANDCVYTISDVGISQHSMEAIGMNNKMVTTLVATCLPHASVAYEGVVVQDIFGKTTLTIPYQKSLTSNVRVSELDGYRILDAKRVGRFFICIAEKNGKFDRITLMFNEKFTDYESAMDADVDNRNINFTVKQNGMCVNIKNDNDIEMFYDFARGSKVIEDTPIEMEYKIYDGGSGILFVNNDKLYVARSK